MTRLLRPLFRPAPAAFAALALALPLPLSQASPGQSEPVRDQAVEAQLISSHARIAPGEPFTLALRFRIDPTWHTYWVNPGEAGLVPRVNLNLPEGFEVGELGFPPPKKFVTEYPDGFRESGYGYEDEVVHPFTVTPPSDWEADGVLEIQATVTWLMCDPGSCVPGRADLALTLEAGAPAVPSAFAGEIERTLASLPRATDWSLSASLEGGEVVLTAPAPPEAFPEGASLRFFPLSNGEMDTLAEPEVVYGDGVLTVTAPKNEALEEFPESFAGLLSVETAAETTGYLISTDPEALAEDSAGVPVVETPSPRVDPGAGLELPFGGGILGILLAAFLGGMILNIMPCVFPVISLKVMSFVGQAGEDRRKVFLHAAVFTLGILVFFWLLTAALLVLRGMGSADVGWGVQLRHPGFVLVLIFVMLVVALALFGVFELGAGMTAVGGELASKAGYAGSFWSGALAVLLATPCTAPLMAPAIGFALVQPAPSMIAVFTMLGLGLAAPYFVFAVFPKLMEVIPAPGAWMETFKQAMGFPMLAVAAWLIAVLSRQLDAGGLLWALASLVVLAMAAWILGRFASMERRRPVRIRARVGAAAVFLLSLGIAWHATGQRAPAGEENINEVIAAHREAGRNVFVDFTADWCVTCKANERITLKTDAVQQAFRDNNIEFVIADWTNPDPHIAELLRSHGQAGVPFYLLYPADTSLEAIPLPVGVITRGDVMAAIEKLPEGSR